MGANCGVDNVRHVLVAQPAGEVASYIEIKVHGGTSPVWLGSPSS
jgi:hypothetical protein